MYSIMIAILISFSIPALAQGPITGDMFTKFNEIKTQLLAIDLKKPENDKAYVAKLEEAQSAFETLNAAYWNTPKAKITTMISASTNKAAVDLQFLKTPESLIKAKFDKESCYEGWRELKSSATLETKLFDHFKAFIKARCKADYTPEINDP